MGEGGSTTRCEKTQRRLSFFSLYESLILQIIRLHGFFVLKNRNV